MNKNSRPFPHAMESLDIKWTFDVHRLVDDDGGGSAFFIFDFCSCCFGNIEPFQKSTNMSEKTDLIGKK